MRYVGGHCVVITTMVLFLGTGCVTEQATDLIRENAPGDVSPIEFHKGGGVTAGGLYYDSVVDFQGSQDFVAQGRRCATEEEHAIAFFDESDCSFVATQIQDEYRPENGDVLEIPVVFHVVMRTDGTGYVPLELIHSQLEILNEDFRAPVW